MLAESAHLLVRAWRHRLLKDRWEVAYVRAALAPGDCCLDIGSHKGAYAYWMARRVGPRGLVVAFEPQPGYAAIQRRLWSHRGVTQVRVEEIALSDHAGSAALWVPAWGPSPGASLVRESLGDGAQQVTVPMTTLDAYAAEKALPRVSLIKCDVEGHEFAVFRGAEALLRRDTPRLLFECEARFGGEARVREVFAYLASLGYCGWFMWHGVRTPVAEFRADVHQASILKHTANNFVFEG
jgi:FkbM family methyltransferase